MSLHTCARSQILLRHSLLSLLTPAAPHTQHGSLSVKRAYIVYTTKLIILLTEVKSPPELLKSRAFSITKMCDFIIWSHFSKGCKSTNAWQNSVRYMYLKRKSSDSPSWNHQNSLSLVLFSSPLNNQLWKHLSSFRFHAIWWHLSSGQLYQGLVTQDDASCQSSFISISPYRKKLYPLMGGLVNKLCWGGRC